MLVGSQLFQTGHSVRCSRQRCRRNLKLRGDGDLILVEFPCLQSKGSGMTLYRENLPTLKVFPFLDGREKYKNLPWMRPITPCLTPLYRALSSSSSPSPSLQFRCRPLPFLPHCSFVSMSSSFNRSSSASSCELCDAWNTLASKSLSSRMADFPELRKSAT